MWVLQLISSGLWSFWKFCEPTACLFALRHLPSPPAKFSRAWMHSLSHYQGSSVKEVDRTRGRATSEGGEGKGEEERSSGRVPEPTRIHLPKHGLQIPKQAEPWRPCRKEGCPSSSLPSISLQQWENQEFCKIRWSPSHQPYVHLLSTWERSVPCKTEELWASAVCEMKLDPSLYCPWHARMVGPAWSLRLQARSMWLPPLCCILCWALPHTPATKEAQMPHFYITPGWCCPPTDHIKLPRGPSSRWLALAKSHIPPLPHFSTQKEPQYLWGKTRAPLMQVPSQPGPHWTPSTPTMLQTPQIPGCTPGFSNSTPQPVFTASGPSTQKCHLLFLGFPGGSVVKKLKKERKMSANAGDTVSIPGLGRSHTPRSTEPFHHNYWTCALEPGSLSYWALALQNWDPHTLEPMLRNERSHRNEKPMLCN